MTLITLLVDKGLYWYEKPPWCYLILLSVFIGMPIIWGIVIEILDWSLNKEFDKRCPPGTPLGDSLRDCEINNSLNMDNYRQI